MNGVEVDVIGLELCHGRQSGEEVEWLSDLAAASAGIQDAHLAVEFVSSDHIRALNRKHRNRDEPTDVLSFPIDGEEDSSGPRELGDVIICPEHTRDIREAVVHGVLHLLGMDHEVDEGEMLALQRQILEWTGP